MYAASRGYLGSLSGWLLCIYRARFNFPPLYRCFGECITLVICRRRSLSRESWVTSASASRILFSPAPRCAAARAGYLVLTICRLDRVVRTVMARRVYLSGIVGFSRGRVELYGGNLRFIVFTFAGDIRWLLNGRGYFVGKPGWIWARRKMR